MKARIVKNDNFETIGLHIYTDNGYKTNISTGYIYSWGVWGCDSHYSKIITLGTKEEGLFKKLVEIKTSIECYDRFRWDIFEILNQQDRKMLKKGEGLKLQLVDDKIKELETERGRIIMEFK